MGAIAHFSDHLGNCNKINNQIRCKIRMTRWDKIRRTGSMDIKLLNDTVACQSQ